VRLVVAESGRTLLLWQPPDRNDVWESVMKLKLLAALVALGLLVQPTYASSVDIIGQTTISETFLLTGYNSSPFEAEGTLSLLSLPAVFFVPFSASNPVQAFDQFNANVGPVGGVPSSGIIQSGNNGYAESACRYEDCTTSMIFFIPTGVVNIEFTVSANFYVECFGGGYSGNCDSNEASIVGTPTYELELSVPDGLCLEATPLPATFPLFATGLGAMGLFGWRRKRKGAAAIAAA
jgi:hypothetical protein